MSLTNEQIREERKNGIRLLVVKGRRPKVVQAGAMPAAEGRVVLVKGARLRQDADLTLATADHWNSLSEPERDDLLARDSAEYGRLRLAATEVEDLREAPVD